MESELSPIVHPFVTELLQSHPAKLFQLIEMFGSPLHLIFPQIMQETIMQYRKALDDNNQRDGQIYFAAKANKANAFLAVSAISRIGVDVASSEEFRAALGQGLTGEKISVSGPTKHPELLSLAILHNARIGVDDPYELESLFGLSADLRVHNPIRISLRLAASEGAKFGMHDQIIRASFGRLAQLQPHLQLDGLSFHLPGYKSRDRQEMIHKACEIIQWAYDCGLRPTRIDIGGGLRTAYADDKSWNPEHATNRAFAGDVMPRSVYPYATKPTGADQLEEILQNSRSFIDATAEAVKQALSIDVEPGRSLLAHAGISLFRVRGVRQIGNRWLVVVDGNSRHLSEPRDDSEFFIDPILLPIGHESAEPFSAAIAGNTCADSDFLARRFIPFHAKPVVGDLLVYVNTAGYRMDSMESEFHRLPLPHKLVALKQSDDWRFIDDERFGVADFILNKSKVT